jgi:FkbM family methyltransferase
MRGFKSFVSAKRFCRSYSRRHHAGEHRDISAAQTFFRSARAATGIAPERVTTDGHGSYPRAIGSTLGRRVVHRTSAYKNIGLEQDHRGVGDTMKNQLRSAVEFALSRVPLARTVYDQRGRLQARVEALEAALAQPQVLPPDLQDPHALETHVPVIRTLEERVALTASCRDADVLPKVADAGAVLRQDDGTIVQIMFNGLKVVAGGYYGDWMQDLITRCRGHHEPQEEVLFAELVRHLRPDATMIELGGFWSFYTVWFLSEGPRRRSFVVEPDPRHLEVGRANARLNGCAPTFIQAFVGAQAAPPAPFLTESSGVLELPCVSVRQLMAVHGIDHLDLLHCDAQGAEFAVVESCLELATSGQLEWLVVSTHPHQISNDPLTHQRCLSTLRRAGATILAEHDVQESFSGDGLIVAKFGAVPAGWTMPRLSYNRYSYSLFRNPLHDLAQAQQASVPAVPAPLRPALSALARSPSLAPAGLLLTLGAAGPLGAMGDAVLLPADSVMFPLVAARSGWGLEALDFLGRHIDTARSYMLLDIGANVGLFSRQAALRHQNIVKILGVEAEPRNFRILQYNLAGLAAGRCTLWNLALSETGAQTKLFCDRENSGNYSLHSDAMRDRPFDTVTVQCVATGAWMRAHVPVQDATRLLWKSDTQGNDELIISLTPQDVWDRVDIAIVELWRIRKPAFDRVAFLRRIDSFAHKSIGIGHAHTAADVAALLDAEEWEHADLYLWR